MQIWEFFPKIWEFFQKFQKIYKTLNNFQNLEQSKMNLSRI